MTDDYVHVIVKALMQYRFNVLATRQDKALIEVLLKEIEDERKARSES